VSAAGPAAPAGAVPDRTISPPSTLARVVGLGSVFGKSFRDSRRTALALGALYAFIVVVTAYSIVEEFDTVAERTAMARQLAALPAVFQGLLGQPLRIDTLGGFVSWRLFNFLPVVYGIWAIIALSGTLAGELARGSLDVLASTPLVRRRLAIEKVLAYILALGVTVAIIGVVSFAAMRVMARLPGDSIEPQAVAGHMVWLYLMILTPGAAAFLVAPLLGRGGALGVGAVTLFASFVVSSYGDIVPAFDALRGVSYFSLTEGHRPLAGAWDWPSVLALAAVVGGLLVAGIELFARRDLLVPSGGRIVPPRIRIWVVGPFTRGLGERFPAALAWGAILGLYGIVIATSADEFVSQLSQIPQVVDLIRRFYPNSDILSTGGFLQLAFFQQGIIVIGLAAASFVSGWASDEGERRLEVVLGAPIGRAGWSLRSGAAVLAAVIVSSLLLAASVAYGASIQGTDPIAPALGVSVLGLYGLALAGVGLAVGGLIRPSLAAPVTLILGIGSYLFDVIGTILDLPSTILDLSLTRHLGQPMIRDFDEPGMLACAFLAIGGLLVCAMGMRRRDIGR
jgi:ABC-2 type transport system permease protein